MFNRKPIWMQTKQTACATVTDKCLEEHGARGLPAVTQLEQLQGPGHQSQCLPQAKTQLSSANTSQALNTTTT